MTAPALPRVMIVGGADVAARLPLMERLRDEFELVAVGCGSEPAAAFAERGFAYRAYAPLHARVSPLDDARGFVELARIFRAARPQIVHAFDTKAGVWGCLAARTVGVPVSLGTVNGLGFLFRDDTWKRRLLARSYRLLQRLACRASNVTVFQNPDDARVFVDRRLVRPERVVLVPGSGVRTDQLDPKRFDPAQRARLRAELGLGADDVVIIMVTRVIRSKGVLDLLAVARALRATHPRARFLLVGAHEPESMDRLDDAELRALESELVWVGQRSDVPALLAASDAMAFPSGYGEGIPRVLLEAASMALPIVTTDAPGCREAVEPGRNGFLVPIGDVAALTRSVAQLVADAELRHRLGAAGRERAVARFDLAVVAERTRGLYRELLAHGAVKRVALGRLA
jgi:glycosyltransferase involved in cell wall biosynthesis